MSGKMKIDLSALEEKWPSAYVSRDHSDDFSGGLISPKSLANLDSKGEGPEGAIRCGRKVIYPVKSFIKWLENRCQLKKCKNFPLQSQRHTTSKGIPQKIPTEGTGDSS